MYYANTDGSIKDNIAGIGCAIYKGNNLVYSCRKRVPCLKSNTLEYIAVLELIKYVNTLNIKNVIVYTDCMNITNEIKNIGSGKPIRDETIREIIYQLSLNPTISIKWIDRKFNTVAHRLSREAVRGIEREDSSHIDNIIRNEKSFETKMVVRFRPHLMLRCPSCKEKKSATEFPRYKDGKGHRECIACEQRIAMISHGYLRTKNTY